MNLKENIQGSVCIYCDDHDRDSESHVIPEGLGQGPTLKKGVGQSCNMRINREVEEPVIKELAPIRNFLELPQKHRDRAPMEIEVCFGDKSVITRAKYPADLLSKVFVFKDVTTESGVKRDIVFIGSDKTKIEEHKRKYEEKHKAKNLKAISFSEINAELHYKCNFDLGVFGRSECLRMVAKIALEWSSLRRNAASIKTPDYSDVVGYINTGQKPKYPAVSIVQDPHTLGAFRNIPFGPHIIYTSIDPRSQNVVMLVSLFGLFYYKVIISTRYRLVGRLAQLEAVHPQTGKVYVPNIVLGPAPFISEIVQSDYDDPQAVVKRMRDSVLKRLNEGIEAIIRDSGKRLNDNSSEAVGAA